MEKMYKSIENVWFEGKIVAEKELLGKTRIVIEVFSGEVAEVLKEIHSIDRADRIWKGITLGYGGNVRLWAERVIGCGSRFKITGIEPVTGLNWQKDYEALFNVTVETGN